MLRKIHRISLTKALLIMSCAFASSASAFELLSEGAMDSVSAVSAETADDIINIAGTPAAGLTIDGYEQMPFQARIKVDVSDTDEVVEELDFELVQEVEVWAGELRDRVGAGFEVGFVDELPASIDGPQFDLLETEGTTAILLDGESEDDAVRFALGQVDQTLDRLNSGLDSITVRFARTIERAETVGFDFPDNQVFTGSSYVSDVTSFSTLTLTEIRE